ncbi:MAG: hypothetical protein IK141_07710 [Clostridia bacterium]|nr:hypothetical protein [Clostridia bacterium]
MRSKISSCKPSLPVMQKNLTRFWPIWLSYLLIWMLILPLTLLRETVEWLTDWGINNTVLPCGQSISVILSLIYGFLCAAAVWSYLYNQRSASLYHALPVSREGLFTSHFLSGLGLMVLPNLAIFLISLLLCVGRGLPGTVPILLSWLGAVCLQNLFFFCFATLLAMLTGNLTTHAVVYGILNLTAVVCESLLRFFAQMLTYGLSSQEPVFFFLSPVVYMLREYQIYGADSQNFVELLKFPMLLTYGGVGLALAILALLLYRKRDTERAGDVIAVPFLRPVAKYCFSFGCALVLGYVLHLIIFRGRESLACVLTALLLGGFIGYLTAAMLLKKSFRVFDKKTVAGFCVFALVVTAGLVGMKTDVFGAGRWIPAANQVKSIDVSCPNGKLFWPAENDDPAIVDEILALHRAAIASGAADSGTTFTFRLSYTLASGRTVERRYCVSADTSDPAQPAAILSRLLNDPAQILNTRLPPENAFIASIYFDLYDETYLASGFGYLNTKDFQPLLDAIRQDILAGDYGVWTAEAAASAPTYCLEIEYDLVDDAGKVNASKHIHLNFFRDEAPRTFALLQELEYLRGPSK